MILEEVAILPDELASQIETLVTIFQAIGGLIIIYIVFNIINTIFNRKKRNELRRIRQSIESIDKKMNKLVRK